MEANFPSFFLTGGNGLPYVSDTPHWMGNVSEGLQFIKSPLEAYKKNLKNRQRRGQKCWWGASFKTELFS